MARVAFVVVGVVVLGLAAALAWALTLDPNQHKATIERWASDALGDGVRIEGPIVLTRGLTSTLVVNDLRIAAAGQAAPMVSIGRAEVSLVLTSLLWGPLHLSRVTLDTAQLDLPLPGTSAMGPGQRQLPRIDRLEATNITVRYRQDDGGAFGFTVERAAVTPAADGGTTTLELAATTATLPLKVSGTTGSVAALFASGQGLPISLAASLADAKLDLNGSLSLREGALNYRLDAKLDLPADSNVAQHFALPPPPLAATARLEGDRSAMAISSLAANWGNSDLAGDLTWQVGQAGARGKLSGKLTAQRFNPVALALGPSKPAASGKPGDGVVPNLALPTPAGLPVDFDLEATIGQLDLAAVAVKELTGTARGDGSTLDVSVTQAELGGGAVQGRYKASGAAPDVVFALDAKRVDLARLLAKPEDGSELPKDVSVKVDLAGRGTALRTALGTANGAITIRTGAAVLESKVADMLGKSLFTSIIPGFNASGRAHIVCSVLELEAKDGKARSTALAIDGKHVVIGGGGAIDLATGAIDFVLLPKAKNATLAPLVAPIHLAGTITDPKMVDDAGDILGSASHLLLGIVNPLSLATPVLHPGMQGGEPCLDPSIAQESDPIQDVGGTAIDAVEGTAKGVGSVLEDLGKGAGELLDGITGK